MKFAALAALALFILPLGARAQTGTQAQSVAEPAQPAPVDQEPHHQLMYATADIQVYNVLVPAHQSALMYPQDTGYLSITLTNSNISIDSPGGSPLSLSLPEGAVRFVAGGSGDTLTNNDNQPYHALSIQFLNSELIGRGCRCTGGPADAICSCLNASPLPPNWSFNIGHVFLEGVTLAPGATYDNDSTRTTRFLVVVTPFDALDNTIHEPRSLEVRLPVGQFHWLGPGPHEIQNLGSNPLRFVCVEFTGTPPQNTDQ